MEDKLAVKPGFYITDIINNSKFQGGRFFLEQKILVQLV
jgi:hypothetical protein